MIGCHQDFCEAAAGGPILSCITGSRRRFSLSYGDGSANAGYFVQDLVKVTGNLQKKSENASVIFGMYYNVNLETVKVGNDNITTDEKGKKTIIDSGIIEIMSMNNKLVRAIPVLVIVVHVIPEYGQCIGLQNSDTLPKGAKDMIILGVIDSYFFHADLVISNKLLAYDLENQTLGWTDYNCSSSIMLRDDKSGSSFQVAAEDIFFNGSHATLLTGRAATLALIISMFLTLIL
ncbi:hypothetical protein Sjap_009207 [Stephania japonica]|uniref:Peptidase A1 domain-containing protein n=1 Tax=Stephania japonica TaxID=461633 RepID=A0AAP0JQY2_9MAGN